MPYFLGIFPGRVTFHGSGRFSRVGSLLVGRVTFPGLGHISRVG